MDVKIEIGPQCTNKDCGQEFNSENFNLAVCLYGVFFLIGHEKGFVGFTCPKCLKTITFKIKSNFISKIIEQLTSWVEIKKGSLNENGQRIANPVLSFEPDLKYYSQFMLDDEVLKKFDIRHYGFSNLGENQDLSGQINNFINEELPDSKNHLCSYIEDSKHPAEGFTAIYWYREDDIESLLAFENDHNIRIFPRYHYYTDLVESIDSLLGSHYFMGKDFEKAKEDHEKENRATVETLKAYAREKNINFDNLVEGIELDDPQALQKIIEENQQQKARDPKISGMFLDVLVSDPFPLKIISEGHCDYLWAEVDPFHDKDIPEYFTDELEDERLKNKICEMREHHLKMVELTQKNFTKSYVQEFLKSDLIPFLKKYEIIARSKGISYAEIWKLKEGYLEALYEEANVGLRSDKPFAMYQEGKGWKIVFNGKPYSGLIGIGFLWIYQILLKDGSKVYYSKLNDFYQDDNKLSINVGNNTDPKGVQGTFSNAEQIIVGMKNTGEISVSELGKQLELPLADKKMLEAVEKEVERSLIAIREAKRESDFEKARLIKNKLYENKEKLKQSLGIEWDLEDGKVKAKAGKFKDQKSKMVGDRIKKNYRDAMKIIKNLDVDLYLHFSDHIRSEGGAFIYTPSKDIDWHLS